MSEIADALRRYADFVTAGDVDGILSLYAADARIEIPVGGPIHEGIDAVRAFYRDNELAKRLEITGNPCVAGREAAVPMRAVVARGGERGVQVARRGEDTASQRDRPASANV